MNMVTQNVGPKELRSFALVTGGMFAAIFGLLLPWVFGLQWPLWPWLVCGVLAAWGLAHPASLKPVHAAWMTFAEVLGHVNNRIVLGVVFFALITPFGWLRRLVGRDPMARRYELDASSYRKPKGKRPPDSLERPF